MEEIGSCGDESFENTEKTHGLKFKSVRIVCY